MSNPSSKPIDETTKKALESAKEDHVSPPKENSSNSESFVIKKNETIIEDKRDVGNNQSKPNAKKSSGIGDTLGSFWNAATKSGEFKDSKDGILKRLGTALNNADDMTKMFVGAGFTAGALGLINSFGGGDDDSGDEDELNSKENSAATKASDVIRKKKEESQTIASRIEDAMSKQNVTNNLAGSGVMMRQLAMISIKTQESLITLVEYIQKSTKSTNNYLTKLKEAIEDIDEDSGSVFQGLFPLLIGGLMAAITGFLGGGEEGKSFLETLVDKVTDPIINKVKGLLGIDENPKGNFLDLLKHRILELLKIDEERFDKTVNNIISLLSGNFLNNLDSVLAFIAENKDSIQKMIESVPGILDSLRNINNHAGSINDNLSTLSDFIRSFIGDDGTSVNFNLPKIEHKEDNGEKEQSWQDRLVGKFKSGATTIIRTVNGVKFLEEKLAGTEQILKEFISSIKVLAPLVDSNKRKELFEGISNDFTDAFQKSIEKISKILNENLEPYLSVINNLPKIKETVGEKNFNFLIDSIVTTVGSKTFEVYKSSGLKDFAENIASQKAVNISSQTQSETTIPSVDANNTEGQFNQILDGINEIKDEIKKIGDNEKSIASVFNAFDKNLSNIAVSINESGSAIINTVAQTSVLNNTQQSTQKAPRISAEDQYKNNSLQHT